MRHLHWPGVVVTVFLLLVLALGGLLFLSPTGTGVLIELSSRALGPALSIHGWRGTLATEICAEEVSFQQDSVTIYAQELCVAANLWTSIDFLKISLASLTATRLEIETFAENDEPPGADDNGEFSWPVVVEIESIEVDLLQIDDVLIESLYSSVDLSDDDFISSSQFRYQQYTFAVASYGSWRALSVDASARLLDSVEVAAVIDLGATPLSYQLEVLSERLDVSPWISEPVILEDLKLRLTGDLDTYEYLLRTRVIDSRVGRVAVDSSGAGSMNDLTFTASLGVETVFPNIGDIEHLAVSGTINWLEQVEFDVAMEFAGLHHRSEHQQLVVAGQLDLSGSLPLQGSAEEMVVDLVVRELAGTANGQPITGEGVLRLSGQTLQVDVARVSLGAGELSMVGSAELGSLFDLRLRAQDVLLAGVDDRLAGEVDGSLQITGPWSMPDLSGTLDAVSVGYQNTRLDSVSLTLAGNMDAGRVRLGIDSAGSVLQSEFDYLLAADTAQLRVSELLLIQADTLAGLVSLKLLAPAQMRFGSGELEVDESCLLLSAEQAGSTPAKLCVALRYPQGPVRISIAETQLPELALPSGDTRVTSRFGGELWLETIQPLEGRASMFVRDVVTHQDSREPISLGDLSLNVQLHDGVADVQLASAASQLLSLQGDIRLILAENISESELAGKLSMGVDGIWAVESFLPLSVAYELADVTGSVALQATLAGTLAEPQLRGGVQLSDGGFSVPQLGTELSDVQMQARIDGTDRLIFDARGGLGGGTFALEGNIDKLFGDDPVLSAGITVTDAGVVDLPDYSSRLAGETRLVMDHNGMRIDGQLFMPEASVEIDSLPETAVSVSPDVRVIGELDSRPAQQLRTTDIQLELGKRVRLQAFGLDTLLRGNLRIREAPDQQPEVTGTITLVDGTFEAYGQKLEIERGVLRFIGPVDDPVVDVAASRVVETEDGEFKVTLLITGTAEELTTRIRSSPQLPESSALALLMTGRTLSQMTSREQTDVYGSAIALGTYGVSNLTRNVASQIGLEEIIVEQDNQGDTRVGAAMRLNRDLYLRYTYGVFSRLGGVLLRYRLNSRISVQAHTGDSQSIEIRYGVGG